MWPFTRKHVNGDRVATSRRARRSPVEQLESRTPFALDLLGALSFGSDTGSNQAFGVVTDNVGNSYVAGHFSGTADFDQAASYLDARDIATARGTTDAFLAKYGPDDSLIWVRTMGTDGAGRDMAMGLRTDTSGNLVVSGQTFGQAQFGSFELSGESSTSNVFITTLNTDGVFLSARSFGSVNTNIATDSVGNFYATKFYPLSDGHKFDIIKFDPSGNRVWTKSVVPNPLKYTNFGSTGSVRVGNNGELYVTGQFRGTVDFDPSAKTKSVSSGLGTGSFIVKLDTNGNFVWVAPFVVASSGGTVSDPSLAQDGTGNLVVSGSFYGSVDTDPTSKTNIVSTSTGNGMFVTKLSSSGTPIWSKTFTTNGIATNMGGFKFDALGNIYAKGSFSGTVDFDPSAAVANRTSEGGLDIFILQLKSNGSFGWVETIGGPGDQSSNSWSIDESGTISLVGMYTTPFDVDPDPNSATMLPGLDGATSRGYRLKFRRV